SARPADVVAVDEALIRLAEFDPQQARLVELRFFGGLSIEETADVVEISPASCARGRISMREIWEQAKEILAQAFEQSAEERGAFVRNACGGDAELLAEVESLLENYDAADSLLE